MQIQIQAKAWDAAAVLDAARARTVATALDATPARVMAALDAAPAQEAGRWHRMWH
jgi:hypothetical protein